MINLSEYMSVTYSQIDIMKHTIGFTNKKVTGSKHRKYEPWRNYFFAGESDVKQLNELCNLGFMEEFRPKYYCVTSDGKIFLERVTGVKILPDSK